jgi:hypothetical protein
VKEWSNDATPFSATPASLHRQTFLQRHHYSDGDVSIKTFSIQHKAEKDFELNSGFGNHLVQEVLDRGDIAVATARKPENLSFKNTTDKVRLQHLS